jgi:hypothetical protein
LHDRDHPVHLDSVGAALLGRRRPAQDLDLSRPGFIDGREYAAQKIRQRLAFILGEWFIDQELGIPWFEGILVKDPNLEWIRGVLRREILSIPGIIDCPIMTVTEPDRDRVATCTFRAFWKDGTPIDEIVSPPQIFGPEGMPVV